MLKFKKRHFVVVVSGAGINLPSVPEPIIGFFATRCVKASSSEEAVNAVKEGVLQEWLRGEVSQENVGGMPTLTTERVSEIGFWRRIFRSYPNAGYTFYSVE